MEKPINQSSPTNCHANFRKGLSDYHDGECVTHQLGNDDYKNGSNAPREKVNDFDGSVAYGNELILLDDED